MKEQFKIFYADHVHLPLPEGHRFPSDKYKKTRHSLMSRFNLPDSMFLPSPLADFEELLEVHDANYVRQIFSGDLTSKEQKKIGFPWSEGLVNRVRASTGGTFAAAQQALSLGYGAQLAGGTHHAHYDYGAGYCVFNDFAYTFHMARKQNLVKKVAIIDLDVHHGDGNATLLADHPDCFILNMFGEKNYPSKKPDSDLDVPLEDHINDDKFLHILERVLPEVVNFEPDLILYQAGVDGLMADKLGRLDLSFAGLIKRDELVFDLAKSYEIPIVHVLGGGYCRPIDDTVEAYCNTFEVGLTSFGILD